MAQKRRATKQLRQETWDEPDEEDLRDEVEETTAPAHVLASRVIRTARRRNRDGGADQEKKGIFSGFSGFNKAPAPASAAFGFISNLANGKTDNEPKRDIFSNLSKLPTSNDSPFGDLTKIPTTKDSSFGDLTKLATSKESSFGNLTKLPTSNTSPFGDLSKIPSSKASPFGDLTKIPTSNMSHFGDLSKLPLSKEPPSTRPLHTIFGAEGKQDKPALIAVTSQSTALKMDTELTKEKSEYYKNLKSLNLSVSEWIQSHVDKNPFCILTPIFDDYTKYLKELDKLKVVKESTTISSDTAIAPIPKTSNNTTEKTEQSVIKETPPILKDNDKQTSPSIFSSFSSSPKSTEIKSPVQSKSPVGSFFSQGFSSTPVSKAPMFSFNQTKPPEPVTSTAGFSFGTGPSFSFGGGVTPKDTSEQTTETAEENEGDEPPKVTFTPVVEEDSVFTKRCKVFVKKNGTFGDRGVGTLYLKPIKDSEKFQLIVRADTSLGNLLLNIVLTESIPTQRMGKNNVMLVCIPTSTATPPPVPLLLRVKTADEADELLRILNKYKK